MQNFSIAKKVGGPKFHGLKRSYHRSSTRHHTHVPQSISTIQIDDEMSDEDDNVHHQSTSSTMTNNSDELNNTNHRIDDDAQDIQPSSSSINLSHHQKRRLSSINNRQQQQPPINASISSNTHLLSVRASIQKGKNSIEIKYEIFEFI